VPETRRNEVRAFVQRGLEDFSISRSRTRAHGWGISVPGDDEQVMYVWFDALTNYVTALDYASDGPLYAHFWERAHRRLHVIGKGILRFHAVYWPAMLLSAGLPLPSTLFVHGYLTLGGAKISKSLGNTVDPRIELKRVGVDAFRYWLLAAVPPTGDADYTRAKLEHTYTMDLANGLGNLVKRTLDMLARYREGQVPAPSAIGQDLADGLRDRLCHAMSQDLDPRAALAAVWQVIDRANRYAEATAPWQLAKRPEAAAELDTALYTLAEVVRVIGEALRPFLPTTASRILGQLRVAPSSDWPGSLAWGQLTPGTQVARAEVLFPRL